MSTSYHVSGFLYNLKTQKILLLQAQQETSPRPIHSTIGKEVSKSEEAHIAFQKIINELLGINLNKKNIYAIYDYFHEELGKDNFVFYAETKSSPKFENIDGKDAVWIAFDEMSKLLFTPHTKQDIIVGERVIKAKRRDDAAQQEVANA